MATKKKTASKTVKKKAPKKPAKKKVVKKTKKIVDPHVGKRYFMIEVNGRGGEFLATKASEEFVKYWQKKDGLDSHIWGMHFKAMNNEEDSEDMELPGEFDDKSPEVYPGAGIAEYYYFDDIEHATMLATDYAGYTVSEIKLSPYSVYEKGEINFDRKATSKKNFDWGTEYYTVVDGTEQEVTIDKTLFSRELYMEDKKKNCQTPVPAMIIFEGQRGTFGRYYIQTNGEDFDASKLVKSVLETDLGDFIENCWYDQQLLAMDTNWLSTSGNGMDAYVGYLHKVDVDFDFNANVKEGWENLDE